MSSRKYYQCLDCGASIFNPPEMPVQCGRCNSLYTDDGYNEELENKIVAANHFKSKLNEMYKLTQELCKEFCPDLGCCCEPDFCEDAVKECKVCDYVDYTIDSETKLAFDGKECTIPPHLRYGCTVYGANCPYISGNLLPGDPNTGKAHLPEDDPRCEKFHKLLDEIDELIKTQQPC